jgi:hypothetical protein
VSRGQLNLGTQLCSIADVYDAMRSQRAYQAAQPSERVVAVLKRGEGSHFDRHLVRRFVQLLGIYPPGTLVRINTNEVGVVLRVHAPDPYRPRVKILFDKDGRRYDVPVERNLWEKDAEGSPSGSVIAPAEESEFGIDPLNFL